MRQRSISAVGVVFAGIVPALIGGPAWAIAIALFTGVGLYEYNRLADGAGGRTTHAGYVAVFGACLVAAYGGSVTLTMLPLALAVGLVFSLVLLRGNAPGSLNTIAFDLSGALYLAIPAFAAIALRRVEGTISRDWLTSTADFLSPSWNAAERGLAWLLFVIVVTWLSDTGAYLVGRSFGKTPLVPAISPKKTVEGLAGGLIAAVLFGLLANWLFGLGLPVLAAAGAALLLALFGVVGDLAESLLKRQAGVKDSGTLIPGHGGMLDRIDALLFTWTAGLYLAHLCDRIWA
ncbi:MAG TPA: phosphatidate cytidylyltransferase [Thermomicrobiales bacterium]|nr:phosphatidate cytidylyltransferase [Thermomicrobiales bacterium]